MQDIIVIIKKYGKELKTLLRGEYAIWDVAPALFGKIRKLI